MLFGVFCGLSWGILDAEFAQTYAMEPGQTEHENPLSDSLLHAVRSRTDNTGSLKLYVQSSSLSAGPESVERSIELGVSFPQRGQGSTGMVKSKSSGGVNRDYDSMDPALLQKRAEEHHRQNEVKSQAYLESRRQQKEQGSNIYSGSAIRGNTVIDFDSPRMLPFEDKKVESLAPVRRPPTAPAKSTTMTEVNSLRARGPDTRSLLDALKRISGPIAEEDISRGKKKPTNTTAFAARGIDSALASGGRTTDLRFIRNSGLRVLHGIQPCFDNSDRGSLCWEGMSGSYHYPCCLSGSIFSFFQ